MASFVFVKLDRGAGDIFTKIETRASDVVADLTERVCAKNPHWGGVTAGQVSLHLVADGCSDDLPSSSALEAARQIDQVGWPLERAGISPGAWL